jgi:hypothetical protein
VAFRQSRVKVKVIGNDFDLSPRRYAMTAPSGER